MKIKWVVVANSSIAYIYSSTSDNTVLLITKLEHLASKKKRSELTRDKLGQYNPAGFARGTYSTHADPKEIEFDKFAKEVVDFLEKDRMLKKYQSLILIAPPHFCGLLIKHFRKPLHRLLEKIIEKDIVKSKEGELKDYIRTLLYTRDKKFL